MVSSLFEVFPAHRFHLAFIFLFFLVELPDHFCYPEFRTNPVISLLDTFSARYYPSLMSNITIIMQWWITEFLTFFLLTYSRFRNSPCIFYIPLCAVNVFSGVLLIIMIASLSNLMTPLHCQHINSLFPPVLSVPTPFPFLRFETTFSIPI